MNTTIQRYSRARTRNVIRLPAGGGSHDLFSTERLVRNDHALLVGSIQDTDRGILLTYDATQPAVLVPWHMVEYCTPAVEVEGAEVEEVAGSKSAKRR